MVRSLLTFAYRHPRLVLLLLLVLTASAAPMLQQLRFDISAQSLVAKSDPSWQAYQESNRLFGSESQVLVILSDPDLFQGERLQLIKQTLKQLKQLDFIADAQSLFDVPNIREVDGYIESKPFLYELPQTESQRQQLIGEALANPLVRNNLLSQDGETMAINLVLREQEHYPGLDSDITAAIEQELLPLRQELNQVFQMSAPFVRDQISRQIQTDLHSILPAALAVLIVVLGLSMGRINCSIVPLSSAAISIVLTLSFMAWMEIPVNVLTSIIPALLIIIGSTEDVHLMAEYHGGIRSGLTREQAVQRIPVNQAMAVMLAFVTTFVGFLSITVNDLELLREFGWLVAFGLLVNFLVTTLFVPAYLRLFGGTGLGKHGRNRYQIVAGGITSVVLRFKYATLLLLIIATGYALWGAQFLQVNNNTLAYFDEQSQVRQQADQIHEELSGIETFSIVLDSSIEGTFQKVRYLEEVERLQQFVQSQPGIDNSLSFADFIKLTHKVMEGVDRPQLPLEDEVVQVYMEFVQFEAVAAYVTQDYSSTRILVRHQMDNSAQLEQLFVAIEHFFEQDLKSNLDMTLTGDSVLNVRAADAMAAGQIQSLILMVLVILLLVSVLFVDYRAGLIALIPNVFPVIVLFGVMGYFNIPLDSGTTMVAVIALGICVDDTIHFLSRYHHFTRGTNDVEQALRRTIEHEATPISTTSIALTLGFLALTLSSFQPVIYFGALSALVMVLAMFSTFILTPILLSFTKLVTVWDMLALNLKTDVLRNSRIFRGLKDFQIRQVVLSGSIREFARGDIMIDQGVMGEELYVLLEGTATATHREKDGSIRTLAYLKAGDLFGEVAELSQRERMARVTANEKTRVLELRWKFIRQLARFHPRVAMRLYRNLADIMGQRFVEQTEGPIQARDELTDALTRPYLCEILSHDIKRSQSFDQPLSLMLLEVEMLPNMDCPDEHISDVMMLGITRMIQQFMRPTDVLARWQRCSFMLLLPHSDIEETVQMANRLEERIHNMDLEKNVRLQINTAITGVHAGDDRKDVINRLETQLEQLKQKSLKLAVG